MSFYDIACHVWAIDGYSDDATAKVVNELYCARGMSLMSKVEDTPKWRNWALQELITHSRRSAPTGEAAIAYGGFKRGDASPMHMWLEYKGTIYETMPNCELEIYPATPQFRQTSRLERHAPFDDDCVASVLTNLTASQQNYINSMASYGTSRPMSTLR
jgi:hypothetical protein